MVEAAPARAGDVSDDAVHHLTALLVGVEVLVEKMAEKAPTLRNSDGIDTMNGRGGLRIVFQVGKEIAHRCKTEASDNGVFCFIDDLIDFAGLKSAVEVNEVRIGCKFAVHSVGKTPLTARNRLARSFRRVARGQNIFCTCGIVDGIAFSAGWSEERMAERHVLQFLRWREIRAHQTANFSSSRIVRDGSVEFEILAVIGNVKFPADPGNRVAFAQEKSVAIFAVRSRRTIAVHEAQNSFSAAIGNFKEDGIIPFVHVLGFQEIEVGRKFDFPLRVARRFSEIDDQAVVKVFRIHREIDAADNLLVGSGQSERAAALNVRARNNLDASYMCVDYTGGEQTNSNRQNPSDTRAQTVHGQPPKRAQLTSLLAETNS